ncbi:hypothetical protein [Actinomyces radicidentis]|uniref:hypothetical protein n=1 Tax=Actinomyces radicidentis TaxID=111015 RepID=UPI0028EDC6B2|nr:hypothetical protein [Actinomyces radicidentis]
MISDDAQVARYAAETVQKVYLGVTSNVLTAHEARQLIHRAGADLTPETTPPATSTEEGPTE